MVVAEEGVVSASSGLPVMDAVIPRATPVLAWGLRS